MYSKKLKNNIISGSLSYYDYYNNYLEPEMDYDHEEHYEPVKETGFMGSVFSGKDKGSAIG